MSTMAPILTFFSTFGVLIVVLLAIASSAIKIVQEYFIIPFIDRMTKVDLRVITLDVPAQEAITKDNVTVKVDAVAYFRVVDPSNAIVQVENYRQATWRIAQTTLRSVLGQSELDELLMHRDELNLKLQHIIDKHTEPWGVKVSIVEIKDVELPDSMKRAMARQAEAEREKRGKVIHAQGELEASKALSAAASVIAKEPAAIQLRYLQTLTEIAAEKNSTIIFPLPIEFMGILSDILDRPKSK